MATVATIADTTIVGDNEDQLVTMIVDDQLFGIPILQVQDIVEASKITPVPLAPSAIAGVLNLRGRIVTVVDLRKLLGNNKEVPWESQMGVTVEHKGDLYTLLVDAIGDVRTLPRHDFDKAPSTMEDNVRRLCSGIYRLRGNLLVVLDVARILHTDIIEATPMLTVEERRNRKNEAIAQSDGSTAKRHQLSALMTDLNAYESEVEGVFGAATDSAEDNIKARKRANRHRRPIAERWQEVLEEKARKTGPSAYRMREPDEETIEAARSEMAQEEAEWAGRIRDPERQLPDATEWDSVPDAAADEPVSVLPVPEAPTAASESPHDSADLPPPSDAAPAVLEEQAEVWTPESWADDPAVSDFAADTPTGEPTTDDIKTPLDLGTPNEPLSDVSTAEQLDPAVAASPRDISPAETADDLGMPVESDAAADVQAERSAPMSEGTSHADVPWDAPADDPQPEISDTVPTDGDADRPQSSRRDVGGIASGWWNKLRAKSSGNEANPNTAKSTSEEDDADAAVSAKSGGNDFGADRGETTPEDPGSEPVDATKTAKETAAAKKSAGKAKRAPKTGGKAKTGSKTRKTT